MITLRPDHPYYEHFLQWLQDQPQGARIYWSAWNFSHSPITKYGVSIHIDGYNPPSESLDDDAGLHEDAALYLDNDMDMFIEPDVDETSETVPFSFVKQRFHPQLPLYCEKQWRLIIEYDKERWPKRAVLVNRDDENVRMELDWSEDLERECAKYEYRLIDKDYWMSQYHTDDISNALGSVAQEYASRGDLTFAYRDWVDEEEDHGDDSPRKSIAESAQHLPLNSTVLFSSDHYSLSYPFGYASSDVDFAVEDDAGQAWGYFFMLKDEPDSPSDGLDRVRNYFSTPNAEMVWRMDGDNLLDFALHVGDRHYHVLPWIIGNESYYAHHATQDEDGTYRLPVHTIGEIERAATDWLRIQTGRSDLTAIWDHGAPLSPHLAVALERVKDLGLDEDQKWQTFHIGSGMKASNLMLQWLNEDKLGLEDRYQEQVRYLEDEGIILPQPRLSSDI